MRPSCEMSELEGKAMFGCVESSFVFNRCLRQGSVEAPRLWQKMATQLLANVSWTSKMREPTKFAALCGLTTFGSCRTQKRNLEQMLQDLIKEASRWDLVPKPPSLWLTSTYDSEEKVGMLLCTTSGVPQSTLRGEVQDLGLCCESARKIARQLKK